jgi:hypothetical protein
MKVLTIAALGVLVCGAPALAIQSTAQPPVKIISCVVHRNDSKSNALGGVAYTNGVTAVIVNTTTKTIADFQASGIYNNVTVTDTVKGPFAPGQTYTVQKVHTPFIYTGPDASCVLNHVTFADGTTWSMPAPPMSK